MSEPEKKLLGELVESLAGMEIKGVSIDSRNIRKDELFVAIKGERFDGHDFVPEVMKKGAWGALVERAVLKSRQNDFGGFRNVLAVEDTVSALQEMSFMHRKKFQIPVVGITGSNGKTTTKEMLAAILKQRGPVLKNEGNLNNHLGVPLTLLKLEPRHQSAAVEMGMSAAGEIETLGRIVSPDVGVITNIGPAHLEFLGSLDGVALAKAELLGCIRPGGTAVLNVDDRYFATFREKWQGRVVSFGLERAADVSANNVRQEAECINFTLAMDGSSTTVRLRAVGRHNVLNALAAAAAAKAVGMTIEAAKAGLEDFVPVAMRSELKTVKGRIVFVDYYNANPGSVEAALETLVSLRPGAQAVAVLGDMLELGAGGVEAHKEVGRAAARLGVAVLIVVGPLSKYMLEGAREAGMRQSSLFAAGSHEEAADLLEKHSNNGDAVLIKGSRGMKMEKILEAF